MLNKKLLQAAAQAGIRFTGDIAESITYYDVSQPTYDADTGVLVSDETTLTISKVVFTSYVQAELKDSDIQKTDRKAIIAYKDISITPSIGDKIKKSDDSLWVIKNKEQDFATAFWFLQVRPT